MKAEIQGITFEGTPQEMADLLRIVGEKQEGIKPAPLQGDAVREWLKQLEMHRFQAEKLQQFQADYRCPICGKNGCKCMIFTI